MEKKGSICIHSDSGETSVEDRIVEALENLGFECEVLEEEDGQVIRFEKELEDGEKDKTPTSVTIRIPITIDEGEEVVVDIDEEEDLFEE
jgi:hypothetical protein